MCTLWARRDVRIAAYAASFAAWCVGWVFGALEITRPQPGLMTLRGTGGAYELLPWFIGQPSGIVATALVVGAFLAAWLPLKLLHRLDRYGEARAALRWSLSSSSLNVLIFALPATVIALGLALPPRVETWALGAAMAAVFFLPCILARFAVFDPTVLQAPRVLRWWRPRWPGWRPVIVATLLLWVVSPLAGFGAGALAIGRPWPWQLALAALALVLDSVIEISAAVIWLVRGPRQAVRDGLIRLANARFVGAYLAYVLMLGLLLMPLAVPMLVHSVHVTFVAPQYEDLAKHSGVALSWPMRMLSYRMQPVFEWIWWPLALPATVVTLLWLGRLLVRHGACGPLRDPPGD